MSPFEFLLIKTLEQTRRDLAGSTVPTLAVMARLPVRVPDRTLRYYLRTMECRGLVHRPRGPKSGWAVTLPVRQGLRAYAGGMVA